jgi:hypothetical protein
MATNSSTPLKDRPGADDRRPRGVGMAHLTVVPSNFESDDQ